MQIDLREGERGKVLNIDICGVVVCGRVEAW